MAINAAFGKRAREARSDYQKHNDTRISMKEIGVRVAALVGRPTPFSHVAVGAWFQGQEPESLAVAQALAEVLEVDDRWLAFGPKKSNRELNTELAAETGVNDTPSRDSATEQLEEEETAAQKPTKAARGTGRRKR